MDLIEAVEKCKVLLAKFPSLSMKQIKELRAATSIINAECGNAIWEKEYYKKSK